MVPQEIALYPWLTARENCRAFARVAGLDRRTTAAMLHVAALAGDAKFYQQAIETALLYWREQKLSDMTAEELTQLIESEFWLIPPDARNSGAGFLLKQKLAHVRRELTATIKQ